jgi:hypothetical protein
MAGTKKLRIRKIFGNSTIEEMVLDLDQAKSFLSYFWTQDGGANVNIAVGGQSIKSFEELTAAANQECHDNNAFVDVGLYLGPKT